MCGIFAVRDGWPGMADLAASLISHRGPDAHGVVDVGDVSLAHTRLSIVDLDHRSDQPFRRGGVTLTYNGELWNFRALRDELRALGETFRTEGDTEVVAAALDRWGADALPRFQGMFGLAWVAADGVLRVARDRFGEVPVHLHLGRPFMACSEIRPLLDLGADPRNVQWLPPGCAARVLPDGTALTWRWYAPKAEDAGLDHAGGVAAMRSALAAGVRERGLADVPVCCLLSGGLDSAAVLSLLVDDVPDVVAYTAVMDPRSPDLRAAREVAGHLGVELVEVVVHPPTSDDLRAVVRRIEMPHKAQVEIGWACVALAERMKADGFKVTFSGEGSDELWASYGFSYHGVKQDGWFGHRRKLFHEQHRKNFPRCNKVFMRSGVECRLPFLSTGVVETALSLGQDAVTDGGRRPKAVLEAAVADRIPASILKRPKLAFQDGLGMKPRAQAAAGGDAKKLYSAEFDRAFAGVSS